MWWTFRSLQYYFIIIIVVVVRRTLQRLVAFSADSKLENNYAPWYTHIRIIYSWWKEKYKMVIGRSYLYLFQLHIIIIIFFAVRRHIVKEPEHDETKMIAKMICRPKRGISTMYFCVIFKTTIGTLSRD